MSNIIRRPFVPALDAAQRAASSTAVKQAPQSYPCTVTAVSGSIVTVAFQVNTPWTLKQMTIPVFGPEYIRYPIQVGCKGFAMAASTTLGHMSGLGSPTQPDLSTAPNLSSLVFMPIGNVGWTSPQDANALELYGPTGVRIHTTDNTAFINVTETGIIAHYGTGTINMSDTGIVLQFGSNSIAITASGIALTGPITQGGAGGAASTATFNSSLTTTGTVTAPQVIGGGVHMTTHTHPVPDGTSSAPNPGS
jgi:hypothetical protein